MFGWYANRPWLKAALVYFFFLPKTEKEHFVLDVSTSKDWSSHCCNQACHFVSWVLVFVHSVLLFCPSTSSIFCDYGHVLHAREFCTSHSFIHLTSLQFSPKFVKICRHCKTSPALLLALPMMSARQLRHSNVTISFGRRGFRDSLRADTVCRI